MQDDRNISATIGAQDPIIQELLRYDVEHGVLVPLKTTQELREEFATDNVLITRAPVKSANPLIGCVYHMSCVLTLSRDHILTHLQTACCGLS
jgi:hypothetical protein